MQTHIEEAEAHPRELEVQLGRKPENHSAKLRENVSIARFYRLEYPSQISAEAKPRRLLEVVFRFASSTEASKCDGTSEICFGVHGKMFDCRVIV